MPDDNEQQSKPQAPPELLPPEQLGQLLNAFVTTASNWPENPAPSIHFAQKQSKHAIVQTIKFGLPMPWHNTVDQLTASMTDDQVRAIAVIFTMAFIQGAGLKALQQNGKR